MRRPRPRLKTAIEALKKAMEGEDAEEIKRLSEELTQSSHKLAEAMYQQASAQGAEQAGAGDGADRRPTSRCCRLMMMWSMPILKRSKTTKNNNDFQPVIKAFLK